MRGNKYHNSTPELSRIWPQGLYPANQSTIPPLLLSGEYDETIRTLTTIDGTLPSNGNVEAPCGYFSIFEISDDAGQRLIECRWLTDNGLEKVMLPDAGWYLYTQDNSGISMVYQCEDGAHAELLYSLLSDRYAEYEIGELTEREQDYERLSAIIRKAAEQDEYDEESRQAMSELLVLQPTDDEIERVRTWRTIKA